MKRAVELVLGLSRAVHREGVPIGIALVMVALVKAHLARQVASLSGLTLWEVKPALECLLRKGWAEKKRGRWYLTATGAEVLKNILSEAKRPHFMFLMP